MSTIIGVNRNKSERSSFLLQVRFSHADAKICLQRYVAENPLLKKTPMNKKQVLEVFFSNLLCHLPRKGVESLSEFLFEQSLKHGYIVVVPPLFWGEPTEYIISPYIDEKRPGPKSKSKGNDTI